MQSAEQTLEFHFTAFKNVTLAFEDDTASGCPITQNASQSRHYNEQTVFYLGKNP